MNYFDKNKILTVSIVLLVIINLGILAMLWIGKTPETFHDGMPMGERMQPTDGMPPKGGGPKEFLIRELKFNDSQKKDYEKLVDEHRSDMRVLKVNIRKEKEKLWDILSKPGSDANAAENTASEIGAVQKEIELITFRHFQKVRELCNEDQKKEFDEVIKDALKMMGPGNPPPPDHK